VGENRRFREAAVSAMSITRTMIGTGVEADDNNPIMEMVRNPRVTEAAAGRFVVSRCGHQA